MFKVYFNVLSGPGGSTLCLLGNLNYIIFYELILCFASKIWICKVTSTYSREINLNRIRSTVFSLCSSNTSNNGNIWIKSQCIKTALMYSTWDNLLIPCFWYCRACVLACVFTVCFSVLWPWYTLPPAAYSREPLVLGGKWHIEGSHLCNVF